MLRLAEPFLFLMASLCVFLVFPRLRLHPLLRLCLRRFFATASLFSRKNHFFAGRNCLPVSRRISSSFVLFLHRRLICLIIIIIIILLLLLLLLVLFFSARFFI